ncbi:hypothetical protein FZEAL_9873 [Fusarium zealandicum]|uniref:Uncharacterized protein n=1 Tax=Fusarium zealandicum TaxID=1053134 RepID=A0A8H4U7N6_9HYPO|nr:hypothetical protein FZEAL_9873 [Fusarium zealandicum]
MAFNNLKRTFYEDNDRAAKRVCTEGQFQPQTMASTGADGEAQPQFQPQANACMQPTMSPTPMRPREVCVQYARILSQHEVSFNGSEAQAYLGGMPEFEYKLLLDDDDEIEAQVRLQGDRQIRVRQQLAAARGQQRAQTRAPGRRCCFADAFELERSLLEYGVVWEPLPDEYPVPRGFDAVYDRYRREGVAVCDTPQQKVFVHWLLAKANQQRLAN